jgi:outer membrane immunogenic protein
MKRISLGVAGIAAFLMALPIGKIANAADMPLKAPLASPAPAYSWTGFYIGGNVGYGWGHANNSDNLIAPCPICLVAPLPDFATLAANGSNRVDGAIGGGQIGYNWQVKNYLVGIEADIQASGQRGTNTLNSAFFLPIAFFFGAQTPSATSLTNTTRLDWFGTVRGRLGFVYDRWLVYGTGGLAYGELNVNSAVNPANISLVPGFQNVPFNIGGSQTRTGWTLGFGVESALSANWSWKAEYLYMDLGSVTVTGAVPAQGCLGNNLACNPTGAGSGTYATGRFTDNILRVGLNYRF